MENVTENYAWNGLLRPSWWRGSSIERGAIRERQTETRPHDADVQHEEVRSPG